MNNYPFFAVSYILLFLTAKVYRNYCELSEKFMNIFLKTDK